MIVAAVFAASGGVEGAVAGAAGIPIAFFVGMVSFFSPCILPLLPGYLSYTSGVNAADLQAGRGRRRVLLATALFVLGFAAVFTALGATASALGGFLLERFALLNRIAGALVIAMGLAFLSGLLASRLVTMSTAAGAQAALGKVGLKVVGLVTRERSLDARPRAGLAGAFPLGAAFAVSWTPCVGPGLGAILTLAGTEASAARGAALLFSFSLGFGVWFLVGALAFRRALGASKVIRRHLKVVTATGGAFMVAIGVLLVTNQWERLLAPIRRLIVNFTPPI